MNRRPPRQRYCILRAYGVAHVFRVTLEAVQEAQKTGRRVSIEEAEDVAQAALLWLRVVVASHWLRVK